MHGVSRSAERYINDWLPLAEQRNVVLIAPEFSKEFFPEYVYLMKTIEFVWFPDRLGKTKNVDFSPCRSMNSIVLIARRAANSCYVPMIGVMNHARTVALISW